METRKLHFLIAFIAYPITILHFITSHYTNEELLSGVVFFSVATIIYVGFVYLFFKSDIGKHVVWWGLLLIAIISFFLSLLFA